jgi:hypothetical protein
VEEFSRVHGGRVSRRVRVSASGDRESAALDDEQCIWILEEAYADATAAAALQERMKAEPEFAARLKEAMTLEQYRERLTTAIQKSPHMQQAIEQSPMMEKMQQSVESNPLLQPFQDEKVRPRRPATHHTQETNPSGEGEALVACACVTCVAITRHVMHRSFTCPNPHADPTVSLSMASPLPTYQGRCVPNASEYPWYRERGRSLIFSRRGHTKLGNDCRCWSSSRRCRATRARWL